MTDKTRRIAWFIGLVLMAAFLLTVMLAGGFMLGETP